MSDQIVVDHQQNLHQVLEVGQDWEQDPKHDPQFDHQHALKQDPLEDLKLDLHHDPVTDLYQDPSEDPRIGPWEDPEQDQEQDLSWNKDITQLNCPRKENLTQEIEHGQAIDRSRLHIVDPDHAPAHAQDTETVKEETADLQKERENPNTGYL